MNHYLLQALGGIASGGVLFLVASGLTLIFGAARVVNFAHGALYMIGAFLFVTFGNALGVGNVTFWLVLILAGLAVSAIGVLIELTTLRRIYGKSLLTQLLVTFALVLIIEGAILVIYGPDSLLTRTPPLLNGAVHVFGGNFPVYQLFLMALAGAVGIVLWLVLYRTVLGSLVRAAVSDPELLALSGRDPLRLFTFVFALGTFFAGLAGAAVAPIGSIGFGMDVDVILRAFVVVVIGGLGSLTGAFIASMLVGIAEAMGVLLVPQASLAIVFAVLVVVLTVRPHGLIGESSL